jgi:hypothetical protein
MTIHEKCKDFYTNVEVGNPILGDGDRSILYNITK